MSSRDKQIEIEKKLKSGHFRLSLSADFGATAKSAVWNDFKNVVDDEGVVLSGTVACKSCLQCYSYDAKVTGTKTLKRHLTDGKCRKFCAGQSQPTLTQKWATVPEKAKKAVKIAAAKFVCQDLRPFTAIEGAGMERLAQELISVGAKFGDVKASEVLPTSKTVKNHIMDLATQQKQDVTSLLSEVRGTGAVSFTTDLWTDNYRKNAYMDVTATVIKEDFSLQHLLLSCNEFPEEKKTALNIRGALNSIFAEFEAVDLMESCWFTTDCGSNIIAALGAGFYRIDCMAHRLNTVLRTSWETVEAVNPDAKSFVASCSELVKFAKKGNLQQQLSKSLKSVSPTRWNTLYFMLESILTIFEEIETKLTNTRNYRLIALIDHDLLSQLVPFLGYFKKMTDYLEADKTPTLQNVVLTYYSVLRQCLPDPNDCNILAILKTQIRQTLEEKVDLKDIHWAAVFLDPSTKQLPMLTPTERAEKITAIKAFLQSREYFVAPAINDSDVEPPPKSRKSDNDDPFNSFRTSASALQPSRGALSLVEEIELYDSTLSDHTGNPLAFWKDHRHQYPKISFAARRVLVVNATSALSERRFSIAGFTISDRRSSLKSKTVDAILRVRDSVMSN